ncbi:MAG: shikimate kinase [Bacteroidales bacterium]|jgi:shikimate kinase|nr:shikimate kinase [Bacteroidales bacterium]
MNRKKHVILVGMPGSGKSNMGFFLSKLMRMPFIDTDYYITVKEQKSIAKIFAEHGEDCFRKIEQQILLEIIEKDPSVIATGGGMPCFYNNMDIMNEFAVTVYLELTPEKLFEHLKTDTKRPLLKGKTGEELTDYINISLEQRKSFYEKADITIQAYDKTPAQLATELVKNISGFMANMTQ